MTSPENEQLVEQFRTWLESSADSPDALIKSNTDADATDLFSLYTELAALKNEVRLESRQLKTALEKFGELFDGLQETNQRQSQALEALGSANRQALDDAESRLLLEIIDLRDRLDAGLSAAVGYRATGLARLSAAPTQFVTSLADGMAISLRRMDELLARYRVQPVQAISQRLNPDTMHASAVESRPAEPDGSVIAEVRKGYLRHGELLRLAEVIVNKHTNGTPHD